MQPDGFRLRRITTRSLHATAGLCDLGVVSFARRTGLAQSATLQEPEGFLTMQPGGFRLRRITTRSLQLRLA